MIDYLPPKALYLVQWSRRIELTASIAQGFFLVSFNVVFYAVFVACCLEPMLVAQLPIFFVTFSVLGHPSDLETIVCVPIQHCGMRFT